MRLTSTATATSYTFVADGGFGWAICTIDDAAGVLSIVSDWGNWSHRWSPEPRHLGAPTLTAFLARGSTDYIADKLQGAGRGRRFSAELTVAAWRKTLCESRLASGRRVEVVTKLSRDAARRIWDELEDLLELYDRSLFVDHAYDIDGVTRWITDVPYEDLETEQTPEDRALREVVLPALFEALRGAMGAAS